MVNQQNEKRRPEPIYTPKGRVEDIPQEPNQEIAIERRQRRTQRAELHDCPERQDKNIDPKQMISDHYNSYLLD